jgi:arginyl-tRNA synthetase
MKDVIEKKIEEVIKSLKIDDLSFSLEYPTDISHGEWTTNIAMIAANKMGSSPRELAEKIVSEMGNIEGVEKVEIAGPGFINFILTHEAIINSISIEGSGLYKGKKVIVEYTDPNPFKQFHIGHLMSNAVGQTISNLYESQGAEVKRLSYGGDVGLHVAKAIWGKIDLNNGDSIEEWGNAYTHGSNAYEDNKKEEIDDLNKVIFEYVANGVDFENSKLYKEGKEISQKHFEEIYEILGTKFDKEYFESGVVNRGVKIVNESNIFEESDGAIVFKADEYDEKLHTRVFINSKGVPTYETKELGLAYQKAEDFQYDQSVVVTASEQLEYFKVVMKALGILNKDISEKTIHITHGMMRFADGKMSSRKGNIITGESLLFDLIEEVKKKMEGRDVKDSEKISQQVAVAALKFSILKQAPGKNIIFDPKDALSLEGDSGPYIQYTYTRAKRLIEKSDVKPCFDSSLDILDIEKILMKFNTTIDRAYLELAPQYIATYLLTLAHGFNSFYQSDQIIGGDNEGHNIAIVEKVSEVIKKGLEILGIEVPEEM